MQVADPVAISTIGPGASHYIYAIRRLDDGATYLALCSDDSLRAFRVQHAAFEPGWSIDTRHGGCTQLATTHINNHAAIFTAGIDGTVKVWDSATGHSSPSPAMVLKGT